MSRGKTILFSIIVLAVCYVLATREEVVRRGRTDFYVERTLDVGDGRSIVILSDATPFEIISWSYEIHANDQIVVPTTRLAGCCNPGEKAEFEILSSRDRRLIGLVWTKYPHILLVAHDFASGTTWPRQNGNDTIATALERGRKLRAVLEADNPGRRLILSDEARPSDYEIVPTR
jgi:hypothetical protein